MQVSQAPSPNFNDRKFPVDMLVLHYTGMATGEAALERMLDPASEVSAHYMVWEDGRITQLVPEDKRAWHAGVSSWQGDGDLNSRSIGIEIVNGGHDFPLPDGTLPPYPHQQIHALTELCHAILAAHDIPQSRVVGHSDIAPARKADPGEHFPWEHLAQAGIGLWPDFEVIARPELTGKGLKPGDTGDSVQQMQAHLSEIGYALEASGQYDAVCECVVRAYQRHWLPDQVTGEADLRTLHHIGLVHALFTQ